MRLFAGRWTGALPAADCDASPQWYLAIETDDETTLTWPTNAPDSVFEYEIGETVDLFTDDMETDRGWIAGGTRHRHRRRVGARDAGDFGVQAGQRPFARGRSVLDDRQRDTGRLRRRL